MSDIVGVLGSLFPVLNSHPWAMAALIGVVVVAVAMWLAPRIIVATESLINIRSRLKEPDDWASGDSFLRTSDPVLWRQNLVFNRLRIDYVNSDRLSDRISIREIPPWGLAIIAFFIPACLWIASAIYDYASSRLLPKQFGCAVNSSAQQSGCVATVSSNRAEILLHYEYYYLSFLLLLASVAMAALFLFHARLIDEGERVRRIKVLGRYLQDLGFRSNVSRIAAKYWYHFAIDHPPAPNFIEEEIDNFTSLRLRRHCTDHPLILTEHLTVILGGKKVKCPTCDRKVYSRIDGPGWRLKFNGEWNENDIKLAFAALSDLFSAQNVEKYLRCRESRLEHGGSAEAGAGGPEGSGDEDSAVGKGWFSRALRRQRQRRQPRSR